MQLNLKDKNALVCGSTQGIGKATAEELAKLGANVTLMARNQQRLEEVKATLDTSQGQEHRILVANFERPEQVESVTQHYLGEDKLPIHILINNTGGPAAGKAIDAKPQEFLNAFQMHLIANQYLVSAVVPSMKSAGYGRIINIISTSVKAPIPNLGVSNTIRGAVANWAKTLAGELGEFGITVNNVLPGLTETARLESLIQTMANKAGITPEEKASQMKSTVPAKRFAQATEVANAVAFLASPAASYINGINLPVDGGRTPSL